jgi:AcrR family transcriptional regulator
VAKATEAADEVRERVVETADALFYARGINAVGMDEVRTAAGVSLKRLYAEFPGKEQLVLAVLASRHRLWEEGLAQAASGLDDPRERLLAVFDFLEVWFKDDAFRGCGFINAFGELGATSPAVAAAAREHKQSFQDHVARLALEAGADEALGSQLALLAEGAQTTAAIAGRADAAVQARRAAEILIAAALDPTAPAQR